MRVRRVAVVAASIAALALGPHLAVAQPPASADGALYGVVYDSLTRRPLARAYVQVVRAGDLDGGRTVAADSAGRFRVDSLAPGRYLVAFFHPLLDLLRVQATPRVVELGVDIVRVDLGVPDLARVRPVVCGSAQAPSDSSGLLAGRVRDSADGAPVENAKVVLTWSEVALDAGGVRTEHRRVPVTTGRGGSYVLCGVPAGEEMVVSAAAPGRASGEVALEVPPRGFMMLDLALGDTTAGDTTAAGAMHGTARLTGVVRDSAGRAVRGARVSIRGATASTTADADGVFSLGGLPAGTRTLEVRAIGFALRRLPVDLGSDRAAAVNVRMDRVPTLAAVTVLGTPTSGLAGFLDRRARNVADRFITAEDLVRLHASLVSDALRGMRAVWVVPDRHLGTRLLGTSPFTRLHGGNARCAAWIVLNGQAVPRGDDIDMWVGTKDVVGIEVYADGGSVPIKYRPPDNFDGCSVVLVWTRQ
ncbi:hypothetical protein J421_5170 (plasmid) [Gemmatirosa kalamazoonensis]|uniref:Carboxypeptidase regulatory-like domain-containing protein n=1 Tax=Gemmatirosa kalamazoonensis TaxID=861299 RepID=W0RQX9_9BACT|nr:carboxypeptidase-like regulatory domain-containing protein [Gemmatirosa kalamazoonensis]AHG92705.1 hypothetical protein J421_5170 [Gemmatirosa kalamazoonensis]